MGVRRHRPGPPRPMGSPEAAPGHPEPERRRRPRQRRPAGRARQLPSRPPAAAGCIHFRCRRCCDTASGARGLKGRASSRPWRCPPTERRPAARRAGREGRPRTRAGGVQVPAEVPSEPKQRAGRPWGAAATRVGCTAGSCPRDWGPPGVAWAPGLGAAATPRGSQDISPPGVQDAQGGCTRPRGLPTPPHTHPHRTWWHRWEAGPAAPAPPRRFPGQGTWQHGGH